MWLWVQLLYTVVHKNRGYTGIRFLKSDRNRMWSDIPQCIQPEPDSVMATVAVLLCMLIICMKLRNLCINCSVLTSVIWFVLLLLHLVMRNIGRCYNDWSYCEYMQHSFTFKTVQKLQIQQLKLRVTVRYRGSCFYGPKCIEAYCMNLIIVYFRV